MTLYATRRQEIYQARFSAMKFLSPPYGKRATKIINMMLKTSK